MSEIAYGMSVAAQTIEEATVATAKEANKLLKTSLDELEEGRGEVTFRKIDLEKPCVVTFFDASFGKEEGGHSQAAFYNLATNQRATYALTNANPIEHGTKKIQRVVESTLSAEGSSVSMAIDRHPYARLLFQVLMYGEQDAHFGRDWRENLKVDGYMVTDAKSLYDHLQTTGSLPAERTAMLDLLAAKELIERGIIHIKWCPTHVQLADHLTKLMKSQALHDFLRRGTICLRQTVEQEQTEQHLKGLRQGQRARRKERMKDNNNAAADTTTAEPNVDFFTV